MGFSESNLPSSLCQTLLSIEGLLEEALNAIVANAIHECAYGGAMSAANSIDGWQG